MIVCTQACLYAHVCIQANMHACVCERTWILEDNLNSSSSEAVTLLFETGSLAQHITHARCAARRPASSRDLLLSGPSAGLQAEPPHRLLFRAGSGSSTTSLTISLAAFLATDLTRSSHNYIEAVLSLM